MSKPLDPFPYVTYIPGGRSIRSYYARDTSFSFEPRSEYEQDETKY